jgi:hypothetical protein
MGKKRAAWAGYLHVCRERQQVHFNYLPSCWQTASMSPPLRYVGEFNNGVHHGHGNSYGQGTDKHGQEIECWYAKSPTPLAACIAKSF